VGPVAFKASAASFAAVMAPIIAMLLTLTVVYPTWIRYTAIREEIETRSAYLRRLEAAQLPAHGSLVAAADDIPGEPSAFLGEMAALANASQCELTGLALVPTLPEPGTIRPIRVNITIAGTYPAIRSFLARLRRTQRLFVVAEVSLHAIGDSRLAAAPVRRVEATIGIERYVAPPLTPPAPGPGSG